MLFLLTGSNYVFGLITVPYLTRVLGADLYGQIGFGSAFYTIALLFLDFGFLLSGTLEIAKCGDDRDSIERVYSAVLSAKVMVAIPVTIVASVIILFVDRFNTDPVFYFWWYFYAVSNSMVPDFLYRGLENMSSVTIRNVIVKAVFAACIFLFVQSHSQYMLVPVFHFVGAAVALIIMYVHVRNHLGLHVRKVPFRDVWDQVKKSSLYFLSRIAGTVFSSMNTMVLGFIAPTGPTLGYYTATNTAIHAGQQAITPVTGSLFPNIVRTKNYKMVLKVAFWGEVILISGCVAVAIIAEPLCIFVFGPEYAGMTSMLRIMLPMIPITLLTYLFGWAGLGSMGKDVVTNVSVIVGAVFHASVLAVLFLFGYLDVYTMCIATVATQMLILAIRAFAFVKGLLDLKRRSSSAGVESLW
ncbi:Putative O-antigen transporter [Slackia heliotrinireducens]|nr:Putative O-antigen transporter [Slackia heliotrinireducens]